MDEGQNDIAAGRSDAQRRVQQASALFASIVETLTQMLEEVRAGNTAMAKRLPGKQAELETALTRCSNLERDFNEKHASGADAADIDFDAVRRDIGCRLDRIRECCRT